MKKLLIISLTLLFIACGKATDDTASNSSNSEQSTTEPAIPKIEYATLEDAIKSTKPDMADFADANLSKGAALFAYWATDHLKWTDLQRIEGSKFALVMKDPDTERGKRLCASASIVEIQVDNTMPNHVKVYVGGMFDSSMRIYRFIATGSTGELVAGSTAKFCGIITGKNDYQNSAGGVGHAVHLVGMFDLPENK